MELPGREKVGRGKSFGNKHMSRTASARNVLNYTPSEIDHGEAEEPDSQAARCRRLAAAISDRETCELLNRMAEGYEQSAAALRRPF